MRLSHRVFCDLISSCPGAADLVFTDLPYNVGYEGYTEDRLTI